MYLICGEALFDLFLAGRGRFPSHVAARPGGSPFNVAVGLARLGSPVGFFGGISRDELGTRLRLALEEEGVVTKYLVENDGVTTLSLVALGPNAVPQYTFYGNQGADRKLGVHEVPRLEDTVSHLHFGSYTVVVEPVASAYEALAVRERADRWISFDPNVREAIEPNIDRWRERVGRWLELADIVKVSREDLERLFPEKDAVDVARSWHREGIDLVVLTLGHEGAMAWCGECEVHVPSHKVSVVDTVGAGDSFQSALLHRIEHCGGLDALREREILREALGYASAAAAITCSREGADPPTDAEVRALLGEPGGV